MHQFLESFSLAIGAIWANKLRSFLTVLGNIVAVTSIIAVVSLIQGLNTTVTEAIVAEAGADSFTIERMGVTTSDEEFERALANPDITLEDAEAIRRFSRLTSAVMAQAQQRGRVTYRDRTLESVSIQGVSPEYVSFGGFTAATGRLISPIEIRRAQPVTVLGSEVADRLFEGLDPLDRIVKIEGMHVRVVGVSRPKGAIFGQTQDEFAVVPLPAFERIFGARPSLSLMVRPRDPSRLEEARDEAIVALRMRRGLKPRQENNFGVFTSGTMIDLYRQATTGIFTVLIGVVALSLVVGGVVIMNIMLMVVTERTREIGLRKAIGARRRDIVSQVLTEAVTLSTFGGLVGTLLGAVVAVVITRTTPVPAAVEGWSVALGISITAVVGLFFGLYPAVRAARLDPIEALRRE
jgi:putative ABC transport system permease protein